MTTNKLDNCATCGRCVVIGKDKFSHPLLGTLQCPDCHYCYKSVGDLTKYRQGVDLQGHNNYCQWCLDGGDLILCSDLDCKYSFCATCIERNFGKNYIDEVQNKGDWYCFVCDHTKLKALGFKTVHQPENTEYIGDIENIENTENIEITENTESTENNTDNIEITENTENIENTQNIEITKSTVPVPVNDDSNKLQSVSVPVNDNLNKLQSVPAKINFGLFTTSSICARHRNHIEPSSQAEDTPFSEPTSSPFNIQELQKELDITDESDSECSPKIATPPKETFKEDVILAVQDVNMNLLEEKVVEKRKRENIDFALEEANLITKRVKIHCDFLYTAIENLNQSELLKEPKKLASWNRNLIAQLGSVKHIISRCEHLNNYL